MLERFLREMLGKPGTAWSQENADTLQEFINQSEVFKTVQAQSRDKRMRRDLAHTVLASIIDLYRSYFKATGNMRKDLKY